MPGHDGVNKITQWIMRILFSHIKNSEKWKLTTMP